MKKQKNNKNSKDGLTIRVLTTRDANSYFQIAREDEDLKRYARFFIVSSIDEAKKKGVVLDLELLSSQLSIPVIACSARYNEAIYGLFTKSNRLVAVFDVNDNFDETGAVDGAIVHYFVGKKYRGNNYAYRGIKKLASELAQEYLKLKFEIRKTNHASLAVQAKLGSEMDTSYASTDCNLFVYNI